MLSLIKEYNLPYEFPENVVKEVKKIKEKISKEELKNRLDLRNEEIFTIDGEDAKDLDDAIYVKKLENDQIRIMSIDNVRASNGAIKNDDYSAIEKIYAIIRSDIPENSQTRRFVEYITSKDGQAIIEQCGYVNLGK